LSFALIQRGIRVNVVSHGPISTPLYRKLGLSEAVLKTDSTSIESQVPVGCFGVPARSPRPLFFLASGECAFNVGSEPLVDGGLSL
jgi:NAD(P)-dependent dehydrogenase (short-subunit alcohol dehydrogenase family)